MCICVFVYIRVCVFARTSLSLFMYENTYMYMQQDSPKGRKQLVLSWFFETEKMQSHSRIEIAQWTDVITCCLDQIPYKLLPN